MTTSDIAFLHIPKTGGTAMLSELRKLDKRFPYCAHVSYSKRLQQNRDIINKYSFTVVRDPVDVLMSFYRFALTTNSFWHNAANLHPAYHLLVGISFDEFIDTLYNIITNKIENTPWFTTTVPDDREYSFWGLSPQHYYICIGDNIMVNHVGSFSDINKTYVHIFSDILGLPNITQLPHINKSISMDIVPSSETIRKISELYADDYRILGQYF